MMGISNVIIILGIGVIEEKRLQSCILLMQTIQSITDNYYMWGHIWLLMNIIMSHHILPLLIG
jgi:hypothetical protein